MKVRKGHGARFAVSVVASVVLALAVVPMLSAGLAWGLVGGTIALAIIAGVDAALVLDRMLNTTAPAATGRESLDLAA